MESKRVRTDSGFQGFKSLKDFGYGFNADGKMRKLNSEGILTDQGFQFEVKAGDRAFNQRHYEALGEIITEEVYELLQSRGQLKRIDIDGSFLFGSENYENQDKMVVLIHGSGVVRAGQWTRKLIINEDLEKGTMLPFINHFLRDSWGVLVMNTNHNQDQETGERIPNHESPEKHARSVWKSMISLSKAKSIVVIAHSYGGVVVMDLASKFQEDFLEKVDKVLLTDSVHFGLSNSAEVNNKLKKICINYVASDEETGVEIGNRYNRREDVTLLSAGDGRHEWTSWSAMEHIFKEVDSLNRDTTTNQSGESSLYTNKEDGDDKKKSNEEL